MKKNQKIIIGILLFIVVAILTVFVVLILTKKENKETPPAEELKDIVYTCTYQSNVNTGTMVRNREVSFRKAKLDYMKVEENIVIYDAKERENYKEQFIKRYQKMKEYTGITFVYKEEEQGFSYQMELNYNQIQNEQLKEDINVVDFAQNRNQKDVLSSLKSQEFTCIEK